jgi:prepilin-type N-terminal cleavage/methylation domain-containing protein
MADGPASAGYTDKSKISLGFTLLELIISSLLIALVALAIYSAFSNGLKLWARANQIVLNKEQASITLERMARDVRNIVSFSPITIDCKADYIFLPVLVNQNEDIPVSRLAQVLYSFDKETGIISRQQQVYGRDKEPVTREMATNIKLVILTYRYYDPELKLMTWRPELDTQAKPSAVKVEIVLQDKKNETEETLTRIIALPR